MQKTATRIVFSLIVLAAMTSLSSCKKIKKLVQFDLDYKTEVTIPSSTGINLPFNLASPDVETDSEASFREKDTRKDLINEILLTELRLTITSPDGEDFSFLESARVFINAPGIDEKEIAFVDPVPSSAGSSLNLETKGVDLAPFVKADEFSLRVKTVTDEFISQDHVIEIYSKFQVEGKLIGD